MDNTYCDQTENIPFLVIGEEEPSLMGKDRLKEIRLDWGNRYKNQSYPSKLQIVLNKHKTVGSVKDTTAKIHVDEEKQP